MPRVNGRLKFDEEFENRPIKEQLEYLHKLASSQNHALDQMQKERNALRVSLEIAQQSLTNAQLAFDSQKATLHNVITQNNVLEQENGKRIMELQSRVSAQDAVIKALNDGNKH